MADTFYKLDNWRSILSQQLINNTSPVATVQYYTLNGTLLAISTLLARFFGNGDLTDAERAMHPIRLGSGLGTPLVSDNDVNTPIANGNASGQLTYSSVSYTGKITGGDAIRRTASVTLNVVGNAVDAVTVRQIGITVNDSQAVTLGTAVMILIIKLETPITIGISEAKSFTIDLPTSI